MWDNRSWFARFPARHPVFKLPGVGVLAYFPDVMHCMHLGAWQYLFGSVLAYLVEHKGGRPAQILERLWSKIQEYYQVSWFEQRAKSPM